VVLEYLFPEDWLEKKVGYAFLIAVIYSTLGIVAARLLFGANSGIVSVIFTSLLILPYLQKMFKREEHEEEGEEKVKLQRKSMFSFFRRNQAIRIYAAIFLGIYLTYMFYSFILPQLGFNTFSILKEQLFVDPALRGRAFDTGTFFSIISNNWWVLLACFLLAIIVGDGAIFFITWNASSWGALFGYRALAAAVNSGANPLWYLFLVFIITLPHVILEAGGYILAAISGNIISDEIIKKKSDIITFIFYGIGGAALIVLFKLYFRYILNNDNNVVFSIICLVLITVMLRVIINVFKEPRLKKVFNNNYNLFILAIIIFLLGALIETIVLNNSFILNKIYALSMMLG
jgi:uncharacterized membrane protein SpoIIM required for sporulation